MQIDVSILSNFNMALSVAGVSCTYVRDGVSTTLSAIKSTSKSYYDVDTEFGYMTTYNQDFIVKSEDLVLNGVKIKPQNGDELRLPSGTYQVYEPQGQPAYYSADPSGLLYRIHTQQI